ncbi:MAG: CoA transferase [Hyphomicrobiaceae bacterium]|nr:MAG: CoA transferase [Hyphomicrobiaceae bacterium]
MTARPQQGPLAGMRVLDLSHVMAGPICGLMLADMGADVIKIESLDGGDTSRQMLTPSIKGEPASFMMMNRNKRGLALDLKKPKGKEVLKRLTRGADVLIENYRYGTMEKLGLGYDTLQAENPGLIYCEISGYGRTGPLAKKGGFDLVAQGMSGLMAITGEGPGRPPVKVGSPITDITAGLIAAMGVAAAYAHKLKTGQGQRVDTSLFEAGVTHTYWQSAIAFATGVSPGPLGSAHPLSAPYEAFETRDGWLTLGASNQKTWLALLKVLDDPALANDDRFKENAGRMAERPALVAALSAHFKQRTTADWLEMLDNAGVPAGPVLSIKEMHTHPQTLARDMVPVVEHATAGRIQTIGSPVKFTGTPGGIRRAAPLLGQHTREILGEVGYAANEIADLLAETVVAEPSQNGGEQKHD